MFEKKSSMRTTYGKELVNLGKKYDDLVVLDADLAKSTKTELFKNQFPERFFDMGISEADMVVTAAGLASVGFKPFCSSFAIFLTGRVYDQIRNSIAYPHWNVKLVSTHAGISVGEDGASHQMLEDIALTRVIPDMTILSPSDSTMVKNLMEKIYNYDSYLYMRLSRNDVYDIYEEGTEFNIGESFIHGIGKDITIIATGQMVSKALEAEKTLKKEGIACGVVDMYTIKPLDTKTIDKILNISKGILVCEEHSYIGGLFGAISEYVVRNNPVIVDFVALNDTFGESGKVEELFEKYGLDKDTIIKKGKSVYDRI
ncbi:MAG: Transketolase subunit B [candidate division TA06 bacterium 32_111]|uniref:Transketolase subunit B n=2 Tax=Bacteria candidate phyla TaxID=1783234 RepID=A0A101I0N2_UNCT6|nr:MAG: Transketolase subunit B [candidate division TA06 bacterium 32_111]KUK86611.1 MAG: Transketolase subunit B [candidate division TA06 bacterium 34_109]